MTSLSAWPIVRSQTAASRPMAGVVGGPERHIPALDGIRGLAVLLVLVFHIFQFEPAPQQAWLRLGYSATRFGQTGVDLFFVLSGFLITGILLDTKASARFFVNFYGRRTLRIFPLYYGVLILFLLVLPRVLSTPLPGIGSVWLWTFSTNFALSAGHDGGLVGHFWTLAIEEQFYLVWPLVVYCLSRANLIRICVISLAAAAVLRVVVESYGMSSFMLTPCRIDTLLLGALLALGARSPLGQKDWSASAVVVAVAVAMVALPLCVTMSGSGSVWLPAVKYPMIGVFYAALLVIGVSAHPGSTAGRLLNLGPLRSLGKYSYGIYVYHPPIIIGTAYLFERAAASSPAVGAFGAWFLVLKIGLIFAASFAAAWLSWHLYEKRFLTLKRYFEYKRPGQSAAS